MMSSVLTAISQSESRVVHAHERHREHAMPKVGSQEPAPESTSVTFAPLVGMTVTFPGAM